MKSHLRPALTAALFASLAMGCAIPAFAQSAFVAPDNTYSGRVSVSATERGAPVVPGTAVTISGRDFKPGQEVVLKRGETLLNADGPFKADAEGQFSGSYTIPADAIPGLHPVIVTVTNPSFAEVIEVKVSPDIPVSGSDKFEMTSARVGHGLYQVAYSAASKALFVTSAVGRPPVAQSELFKLDPETLEILARTTPADAPKADDGRPGGVFAVYGVGVDDSRGTVWVTNTRQNTVAVYNQADLSLVKQFAPGTATHARDVVIDEKAGKVYVSATTTPNIVVIDAETLAVESMIEVPSSKRRTETSVGSLQLDTTTGKLVTVSLSSDEAAIIDTAKGEVEKVFALPGAAGAIGVGYDGTDNLVFVASQRSDNLLIVDAASGDVLHDVKVGAGPLNLEYEPKSGLVFVATRGSGTVGVIDKEGNLVANLDAGTYPNHLIAAEDGRIFMVNKSAGEDDPEGDRITRITPAH